MLPYLAALPPCKEIALICTMTWEKLLFLALGIGNAFQRYQLYQWKGPFGGIVREKERPRVNNRRDTKTIVRDDS